MSNKKHTHRSNHILHYCDTPREQKWCSCKLRFTRTMLIRLLCRLIEALECKCDKPSPLQELWLVRGETTDPIAEFLEYRKEHPYHWRGQIDEDDTWGLSELRDDQMN